MKKLFRKALIALFCLFSLKAISHESRPILLDINEIQTDTYSVVWKSPVSGLTRGRLYPEFPEACQSKTSSAVDYAYAEVSRVILRCDGGLSGKRIAVHDLEKNIGISALVRVAFLSGESHSKILFHAAPDYVVPERENVRDIIQSYTTLGMKHIFLGIDHLLFVLCLVLMIRSYQLLFWTITGFTLAHSLSLALSVLELVRLPGAWIETCIALSIMFLAAEILRGNRDSLSYRYPFLISSLFGLFHGFGFADALLTFGLPQTEFVLGLLFFNLGVEAGQIVFIIAVLLIHQLYKTVTAGGGKLPHLDIQRIICPAVGSVAAFWVFQRLENFV